VELMQERMTGEKIASERTIFDVELIERDSVRKLNGARQREG
jgi:DNA-binding LacI/PurR family transcriptional regulator